MPKRSRKTSAQDFNQLARSIVDRVTGVTAPPKKSKTKQDAADIARAESEGMGQPQKLSKPKPAKKKDPAAVALGRKGGLKGGKARAAKLTKEQLSESAKKAAKARWAKNAAS